MRPTRWPSPVSKLLSTSSGRWLVARAWFCGAVGRVRGEPFQCVCVCVCGGWVGVAWGGGGVGGGGGGVC